MADGDLRDQIARLEAEIEELAKTLEGAGRPWFFPRWPSLPEEFDYWLISS
jgi:hypothetical protein